MSSIARKMDEAEIEHFKEELEVQRERLRNSLRRAEAEQRDLDTDRPPELGDFCAQTATREYFFERISLQRRLLHRIEIALQRIQAGTFGECIACGEAVSRKRLQVMPWTEYCLRCQEERERRTTAPQPNAYYFGGTQRVA